VPVLSAIFIGLTRPTFPTPSSSFTIPFRLPPPYRSPLLHMTISANATSARTIISPTRRTTADQNPNVFRILRHVSFNVHFFPLFAFIRPPQLIFPPRIFNFSLLLGVAIYRGRKSSTQKICEILELVLLFACGLEVFYLKARPITVKRPYKFRLASRLGPLFIFLDRTLNLLL